MLVISPAIPPTKLPVIVITSPTSKLVPAAFTATDCIPPLALVTTLNVAPLPSKFPVPATPVYV